MRVTRAKLRLVIALLTLILALLLYSLYTIIFPSDDTPKQKSTFKTKTAEGKLREISDKVRD